MFGLEARELSLHTLALAPCWLRGQTPSTCRQSCTCSPSTIFPRELCVQAVRISRRVTENQWKGSEGIWEDPFYREQYLSQVMFTVSPVAAFMGLLSWKGWLSSMMGLGLKLCGSSWIVVLVPGQGPLSGTLSLLGRSKLGWICGNQSFTDYRVWLTSFSTHRDEANVMTLGLPTQAYPTK